MDGIEKVNWLAHRWPIETEIRPYGQWNIYIAKVEGERIGQRSSRKDYDQWRERARPICLARFIAGRSSLHPAAVLITSGSWRLGRIPAELWCGYDVTELLDLPAVTLLSAKARAMFPAWPDAVIRVVQEARLGSLGLKPAPDPRGARLRIVA
jgi:hypothetical protein